MDRRRASVLPWIFAGLGALSVLSSIQAEPPAPADSSAEDPHELIVLLAAGPGAPTPDEIVDRARRRLPLAAGLGIGGPTQVRFVIPPVDRRRKKAQIERDPEAPEALLERYLVLTYPRVVDLEAVKAALERNPQILYVSENKALHLSAIPSDPLFPAPGDPPDEHQWGSYLLSLPDAWERTKGHAWVGVIDTGIDTDHPDLRAFHVAGGSTVYDGGNFRPHLSYDYGYKDSNVDEGEPQVEGGQLRSVSLAGHGTHVAGIVGATTSNTIGVAGACWNCSLIISKASHLRFNAGGWENIPIPPAASAAGIHGAVERGAQVLNLSFGLPPQQSPNCSDQPEDLTCVSLELARRRDVVIVAAAGNAGSNQIDFPASDPRVLAAGGLAPDGSLWNDCATPPSGVCGSNYDPNQLVAPAKRVLSTFYEGIPFDPLHGCDASALPLPGYPGYGPRSGTSMATPYLAGSAGLLRSINPLLSRDDIKNVLLASLENPPGWNPQFGKGKPNIAAAADKALGKAANTVLINRLTPLFSLYSPVAEDRFYTTVPQMGAAAEWADVYYTDVDPDGVLVPDVPGYGYFPDAGCQAGPCFPEPSASVYVFTTDRSPNGHPLVPLYRMTLQGGPSNPDHRDSTYTTEPAGLLFFKGRGYELDGIEGYIYQRCTPEPSCIPAGAVRLYRMYNSARDDYAIFPESEMAQMQAAGYAAPPGLNLWIGYVYPNVDSDSDNVIDGFEGLIGTGATRSDSDCDSLSDGTEILVYPYTDPLVANSGPGCVPPKDARLLSQSVPATMVAGQSYAVSMTWKNAGSQAWSPVGPQCGAYRLGTANNNTWGGGRVELPGAVAPGQQVTLNFTVTAPATPGTYSFQWRMVHECVEWFGDTSPNVAVTVVTAPPTARFTFACNQLSCSFNASSSTDNIGIVSYSWSFGDSTSGSGVTANHAYGVTSASTVTLTVTDTEGLTSSISRKVSVNGDTPLPAESYFAVAPCRLVDTRTSTPLNSGQLYVFNVAGACGIPATAKAVSFNVGVASATGLGFLVFYPGNQSSGPFASSTMNFIPDPSPRFNNATLRLATNGTGTLALVGAVAATPGQFHFVLDVDGYFSEDTTPAAGAQGPLGYQTVTPCRIADTRTTASPLSHDVPRNFTVQGTCGVPVGAAVGTLNLVAVTPSEAGYFQMFQAGTPVPLMATLRWPAGIFAQANGARTRLAASTPDVTVQFTGVTSTTGTSHVVLDAYGYFKSAAPLKYRPVTPCRAVDTRVADQGAPALAADQVRSFQIQGNCGVPVGAKAAMVNIVAVGPSGSGWLVAFPSGTPEPVASVLNFHPNLGNLANGAILPLSTLADDLTLIARASGTHLIVDVFGYFQ